MDSKKYHARFAFIPGYGRRYLISERGGFIGSARGQVKMHIGKNSYVRAALDGKTQLVHRLVALAFLGASDLEVNHIDGNRSNNNALSNLEYVSHAENIRHSYNVLGRVRGGRKLSPDDVRTIRGLADEWGVTRIADEWDVTEQTIIRIVRGDAWQKVHGVISPRHRQASFGWAGLERVESVRYD